MVGAQKKKRKNNLGSVLTKRGEWGANGATRVKAKPCLGEGGGLFKGSGRHPPRTFVTEILVQAPCGSPRVGY